VIANYVTNGGFEKADNCADPLPYLQHAYAWRTIDSSQALGVQLKHKCINNVPTGLTTAIYQYPFKGQGFCSMSVYCPPPFCSIYYNRAYAMNRLRKNLINSKTYCVKFYHNVSNVSSYGLSDIHAYFGDNKLDTISFCWQPLTYLNPQIKNAHGNYATDTLNWTALTGTFTAQGSEKFVVIGNFTANNLVDTILINPTFLPNTVTDICIDHVSCIPIDLEAYAGPDKNCIVGDSVFIGREPDVEIDESCVWYQLNNNGTLSAPIQTVAGLYIKPTYTNSSQTETFVVRQQLWCSGVKWDTVLVHRDFVGFEKLKIMNEELKIYPSPVAEILHITCEYLKAEKLTCQVINAVGEVVLLNEIKFENGNTKLNVSKLPQGIYCLQIQSQDFLLRKKLIIER
ncbi:MAG: T9SS type A sorting domain-containing protein, partial [Bacteroidota bacterium]